MAFPSIILGWNAWIPRRWSVGAQTDVLCKAANIYMCAKSMGSEPDGMTDAQMKEVQDVFNLPKTRPC